MNYSTAIFLVNKDVRAVAVSYELDAQGNPVKPFTIYKTMDSDIAVGDFAVIPTDTRHKMTAVRVEEVDVDIDFDSATQVKWIIDRIDMARFNAIVEQENTAIVTIRSAEKRRKQEELAAKLRADNPELAALSFGNDAALPAPPVEE